MKRFPLILLALVGASSSLPAQTVVYDNTTTSLHNNFPLLPGWRNQSAEVGDEIWLGGTDRTVVGLELLFWYRGSDTGTFDARIRFRPVDENERPGDPIYSSDLFLAMPAVGGMNEYNFAIPNIVVPNRFVWTIEAFNRQGLIDELGPAYFNPPTVGWSDDFFWQSDLGSEWINYSWGGDPYANFAATLTAVPEPSSTFLVAVGLATLYRRRNRK
jgi:PEP-CTERM motif